MEAIFLTEGGRGIGFGHLSRCFALSQALAEKKISSHFFLNVDKDATCFFKVFNKDFTELNWREKLPVFNDAIVFVDSYKADNNIYTQLRKNNTVVAIDDYNRIDYEADVIICPAIYGDKLPFKKDKVTLYLLGKEYIILRKEFWFVPEKKINKKASKVLLNLGGFHNKDFITSLLRLLQEMDFEVHLIAPSDIGINCYKNIIKQAYIYKNLSGKEMLDLMLFCDMAVSAGGQTLYELARVGMPTIGICVANNQVLNLEYLAKYKFLYYAGWYNDKDIFSIIIAYLKLMMDNTKRKEKKIIGKSLVKGKGAKLITDKLLRYNDGWN